MFLSGRLAAFAVLTLKLADQAAKGFKDNVNHYNERENKDVHCLLFSRTRPRSRTNSEIARGVGEWVQMMPPADATDVLHHGKYDSITQTTPFPRGYFQRG